MTNTSNSFEDNLRVRISREYSARGYQLGWRLLYSPAKTLTGAKVAFIGPNPGGHRKRADQDGVSMVAGSAYEIEQWKDGTAPGESPLQLQVRSLFERLGEQAPDVLAGNLVPFRSANWNSLPDKKNALQFGISLWHDMIRQARPSLIITMGKEPRIAISELLGVGIQKTYSVNWGQIKVYRGIFAGGTFIGLPHLSRFKIMNRAASKSGLTRLFNF